MFITLWSLLIYNPLAHIVWGGGFLTGHAIDFAGGTVIHISAGIAGLVSALYLGARRDYKKTTKDRWDISARHEVIKARQAYYLLE